MIEGRFKVDVIIQGCRAQAGEPAQNNRDYLDPRGLLGLIRLPGAQLKHWMEGPYK